GPLANPLFLTSLPVLTGQRALRRELFEALDLADVRGYRVEAALNTLVARQGLVRHDRVLPGLWHRTKEEKLASPVGGRGPQPAGCRRLGPGPPPRGARGGRHRGRSPARRRWPGRRAPATGPHRPAVRAWRRGGTSRRRSSPAGGPTARRRSPGTGTPGCRAARG